MISNEIYNKLYKKYKSLKFSPQDEDDIQMHYEACCIDFDSDEDFIKAVQEWFRSENRNQYPHAKDLSDIVKPKLKKFTLDDCLDSDEFSEARQVANWCHDSGMIEYVSEPELMGEKNKFYNSYSIAIASFYKRVREGEINYKSQVLIPMENQIRLSKGLDPLPVIEEVDKSNELGIDFTKIGKIQ